jgi:hypothetical protein
METGLWKLVLQWVQSVHHYDHDNQHHKHDNNLNA